MSHKYWVYLAARLKPHQKPQLIWLLRLRGQLRTTCLDKPLHFQIESGSFETLIKLADEGLGTTLLPYLHTLDLKESDKMKLRHFKEPKPAREVSLIFPKSELKIHIIDALRTTIAGVIKGAIVFQNVEIISPIQKK